MRQTKKLTQIEKFRPILKEIKIFSKRNSLVNLQNLQSYERMIKQTCPRCLKAHLQIKAKEIQASQNLTNLISKFLKCEAGHHGHYLDNGKLIKVKKDLNP